MSKFYSIKEETLVDIANAIREKTNSTATMSSSEMAPLIRGITVNDSVLDENLPIDNKTYIFIHLEEGRTSPMLCCCPNGTITIDWGDETEVDTLVGASLTSPKFSSTHTYTEPGNYIITLTTDGEVGFYGNSAQGSNILCLNKALNNQNLVYSYAIQKIIFGKNVNLVNNNGGYNLSGLQSLTISNVTDSILPSLHFSHNYALANVTILDGVNAIQANAFTGCYGVKYYDFSSRTSIPTLENTNAFNNLPTDCEIRVPAVLYDEWIAATNWSTYADYIVAV